MRLPKLTLVLGGAASGKTAFAENYVRAQGDRSTYIATAEAFDAEMKEKIDAHRTARGTDWATIEAPIDVAEAIAGAGTSAPVLIDCATIWLSNLMHAGVDWTLATDAVLAAAEARTGPVTIVSNEVGQGIVPENRMARQFRNAQGRLNQRLAAAADHAVLVIAGLPQILKDGRG